MLRFNLHLGGDTGTYYFDDFSLVATAAPVGLRNPRQASGKSLRNAVSVPAVDAAGRSVRNGKTRGRAGIAFTP
jgi:hypothetical protein